MEDDRGMIVAVEEVVFIQNLGGRQMLRFMRADKSICVVVVAEVVFSGARSLLVMEIECSRVVFLVGGR